MSEQRSVYLVNIEGEHGRVKIGSAANPEGRIKQWQTGNPGKFNVESTITPTDGDAYALERALHKKYAHLRLVNGGGTEWFRSDDQEDDDHGNVWEFFHALNSHYLRSESDLCAVVDGSQALCRLDTVLFYHLAHFTDPEIEVGLSLLRYSVRQGKPVLAGMSVYVARGDNSARVETLDTGPGFARELRLWAIGELLEDGIDPCAAGWWRCISSMEMSGRWRTGSPGHGMTADEFKEARY